MSAKKNIAAILKNGRAVKERGQRIKKIEV
jgi:hypothetical protein